MSFVQVEFLAFFAIVFVATWAMPTRRAQNAVLLVASVVFYGWWHLWWVGLLVASASVDFVTAQLMVRERRYRRLWLALSLTANLGLLFVFKYFDFFVGSVAQLVEALGGRAELHLLGVLMPAGISFYTFQTLSYTVDVYRGELRPRTDPLDYLLFILFFPQLVAGPIQRASTLLVQVERPRTLTLESARTGVELVLWGAFKKLFIADTLAPYVDRVFSLEDPAAPLLWAGTTAFMLQLYADFSGYTDLARGTARLLGFELTRNFDEPWRATTTQEFWQRWHISLSTWIRDYLLAPLLGRGDVISPGRYVLAVTATMVIMGLWHGASWNFALFGVFQAACIGFYAVAQRVLPVRRLRFPGARTLAAAFHVLFVGHIGALMFRERDVGRILDQLTRNPFEGSVPVWQVVLAILTLVFVLNLPLLVAQLAERFVAPALRSGPWLLPAQTLSWGLLVCGILVSHHESRMDFVYFQF